MNYRLEITTLSPLLVGGRKEPNGFFLNSRDWISGGVVRAAIAREITAACPYNISGSIPWVEYRDGENCGTCPWRVWCQEFAEIIFAPLYPSGGLPLPLTAERCKYFDDHKLTDSLPDVLIQRVTGTVFARRICPECHERVARAEGYVVGRQKVSVRRRLIMRLAVDAWRQVAADSQLYALRTVVTGSVFAGEVYGGRETLTLPVEHLRLGSKTSAGMGLAQVRLHSDSMRSSLIQRLDMFRKILTQRGLDETNYRYFSLCVTSPLLPDWSRIPHPVRGAEISAHLEYLSTLVVPSGLEAELVTAIVDYMVAGGYRTEPRTGAGLQLGRQYLRPGSVLVYRLPGNTWTDKELAVLADAEAKGIGQDTADGYGRVIICGFTELQGGD